MHSKFSFPICFHWRMNFDLYSMKDRSEWSSFLSFSYQHCRGVLVRYWKLAGQIQANWAPCLTTKGPRALALCWKKHLFLPFSIMGKNPKVNSHWPHVYKGKKTSTLGVLTCDMEPIDLFASNLHIPSGEIPLISREHIQRCCDLNIGQTDLVDTYLGTPLTNISYSMKSIL